MKKFSVIFLIFFLILFTAIVKNSTKRIDDDIFIKEENIRSLKKEFEIIKLEHEYLSSAEQLLEFQNLYFDKELIQKDLKKIIIINYDFKNFNFNQHKSINE
jgi:hypothetical protein|tara:strand:- start:184 stop:489 length:306 start_codon:yes stop_codon:yes gene_type:complete